MDPRSQEKMQRLQEALERGVVMVHLDARRPGVLVPDQFRQDFQLRLNISYGFQPPDLTVGEWGVRETLSFAGRRFKIAVPWQAVFALTSTGPSEAAWIYPEDMPAELIEAAAKHHGLTGEEIESLKREAGDMPTLSVVPPEAQDEPRPRFVPKLVKLEDEPEPPAPTPIVRLAPVTPIAPIAPAPAIETAAEAVDASNDPAPAEAAAPEEAESAEAESADLADASAPGPGGPEAGATEPPGDAAAPPSEDKAARRAHLRIVK